jgi:signal transduction histidine kinase
VARALGLDRVRAAPQPPVARWPAWALSTVTLVLLSTGVALTLLTVDEPAPADFGFRGFQVIVTVPLVIVSLLLTSRRPDNPIGWLLGIAAGIAAVQLAAEGWAVFTLIGGADGPGGEAAAWLQNWLWVPLTMCVAVFVVVLFPDGRLPSRRWRWLIVAGLLATVTGSAGQGLKPGPLENFSLIDNPYALQGLSPDAADSLLSPILLVILGAAASLVVRFRRSRGQERQQIKVVAFAGVLTGLAMVANGVVEGVVGAGQASGAVNKAAQILTIMGLTSIPVAAGIAVLRYGLFEIDVVINKTLVYAALAAFITVVYAGLVAGIGTVIGDRSNLAMSMAAAGVVAVGFQPARMRAQLLANRLVYGERASPYEVLSSFSARLGETLAGEELLERMARLLGEGTGAAHAEVRVLVGGELQPAAVWGEPVTADDLVVPVSHRGEELGALAVTKQRGEPPTPGDEKLVRDLAGQAGLVLRNVALIADLRASRQRLVAAQDEERRRLERNLHDGAQQQLVALKVQLGVARTLAEREGATTAAGLIAQLSAEADEALTTLRDLARGIYPPLLAAEGLPAALGSQAQKAPVETTVDATAVGRYPPDVEATVYFCCLEALQNIGKYASASQATILLRDEGGGLVFTVSDDGRGFDVATTAKGAGLQNMADRLDAVGGAVSVDSRPGGGTAVTGRIPCAPQ